MLLDSINHPGDIKKLNAKEYNDLAREIRQFLIEKISVTGGHLASNLGVVELTMAMYLSFDPPKDKIIWDVGHQAYTHKILSGRKTEFDELRQFGGISGFPKSRESDCDAFNTGHSSTSISAGLGIAQARDLADEDYSVISVIGDGALTGGMAYEAMNNASRMKRNFIIVLNDNHMSISENVGGVSRYLNGIRTGEPYNTFKKTVVSMLEKLPGAGKNIIEKIKHTKNSFKSFLIPGMFFEDMGITYLGPVDGHNIAKLRRVFEEARRVDHTVLVHVMTKKGKGFRPAEKNPTHFHGVSPFDIKTGRPKKKKIYPDYTDVFSHTICRLAEEYPKLVAITAAMPEGTGLKKFSKKFPDRFFDVGIAEEHAVTQAAGMASAGLKPVVAVYSSFLQRGFDQILHDVCIQDFPVVFAIDRAGLVGADGETHQGIFDLSYLSCIPNMSILAPKNGPELAEDLKFAMKYEHPLAIRYPRGEAYRGLEEFSKPIEFGRGEMLFEEKDIAILAVGSMVSTGEHIRQKLKAMGYSCSLANARFIKPIDTELLDRLAKKHDRIIIMEENVLNGGFSLAASDYLRIHHKNVNAYNVTLPDAYVEHGNVSLLREKLGIDSDSVLKKITKYYNLKLIKKSGKE